MDKIYIREAITQSDRKTVFKLRYQVFTRDKSFAVQDSSAEKQMIFDVADKKATLLIAETASGEVAGTVGVACGAVALNLLKSRYLLSDLYLRQFNTHLACGFWLAVKSKYTQQMFSFPQLNGFCDTIGIALMVKAIDIAINQGARLAFISTKPALKPYFEHLGFFYFKENIIHPYWRQPRILMALLLNDIDKGTIQHLSIPEHARPVQSAAQLMQRLSQETCAEA